MLFVPLLLAALAVAGDCEPSRVHRFPMGLADAARGVAYVASDAGYVDAIELRDGKRIWESNEKAKPLALYEDNLVAATPGTKGNELTIFLLDGGKGNGLRTLSISFPDAVKTVALAFTYRLKEVQDTVQLSWTYLPSDRGGAMRRLDAGVPGPAPLSGVKQIDFQAGVVKDAPSEAGSKATDNNQTFPGHDDSKSTFDPWNVAGTVVRLAIEDVASGKQVVLKTVSSSGKAETRSLLSGADPTPYKSEDGCYIFLLQKPPSNQQPWHIFSAGSGKQVGTIVFEPGSGQPDVIGSTAFWLLARHTEPERETHILEAADIVTGRMLWRYVLGTIPDKHGSKRLE
jgi:hypothetical protein